MALMIVFKKKSTRQTNLIDLHFLKIKKKIQINVYVICMVSILLQLPTDINIIVFIEAII